MKGQLKILDDLAQMAGGAVGLFSDIQKQIRNDIKERVDQQLTLMDFVARDDFDRLEEMIKQTRSRQDELETRIEALEALNSGKPEAKSKKTPKAGSNARKNKKPASKQKKS